MEGDGEGWPVIASSLEAQRCRNLIRLCIEGSFLEALDKRDKSKDLIKLSIGNPAEFGNLPAHQSVREAVSRVALSGCNEGYAHSCGVEATRRAVAEHFSEDTSPLTMEDVIMAHSCAGAMEMCMIVLANPGQNILLPNPGFPGYTCFAKARGVQARYYRLKPECSWEADLEDMERLIDSNTAAIVVTNPSNPCGSVFSASHQRDTLAVARRHHLPIISDEVYADMVFRGKQFQSMASLAEDVPVLTCGSLSKRYMVPGWRVGWILIHDRKKAFERNVIPGLRQLAQKLLGPCTLVQTAIPDIFRNVPDSYHQRNMDVFEENAKLCYKHLATVPGLTPIMPAGSMYMMVMIDLSHFPEFPDDTSFTKQLVIEQSVFCLPGEVFNAESCFRIVLIMPQEKIAEACSRMAEFCSAHYH